MRASAFSTNLNSTGDFAPSADSCFFLASTSRSGASSMRCISSSPSKCWSAALARPVAYCAAPMGSFLKNSSKSAVVPSDIRNLVEGRSSMAFFSVLYPRSPVLEQYGNYELVRRLAAGGMAEIFLARQQGLEGFEKELVIKRILPHLASEVCFIRMFLDEARIAARLNHPNIAQIFNLGAQGGTYFIAMEYVEGRD